ncbi:hypothetical protein MXD62_24660 [Frankia sp. Mgl5]|uniref:hypothetical protein n=1 Tax=Frankia sp. Mgl5 TaxID=2933793 RepID=UPI00200BE0E0|nr:hypothetical protein [Frankia sp. Mgl5]MCK9930316.1 hypothetical protein [Frankia sp. Mgl5]
MSAGVPAEIIWDLELRGPSAQLPGYTGKITATRAERAPPMGRPTPSTPLQRDTKALCIGLHPSVLDYSQMPDGLDEAVFTARIEAGNAALREAGFDAVLCLIDTSPDRAEATVREHLQEHAFGLAMIGGGVRMLPENTLLFERLVNLLTETAPGIRLCFNTAPENTVEALKRWIQAGAVAL